LKFIKLILISVILTVLVACGKSTANSDSYDLKGYILEENKMGFIMVSDITKTEFDEIKDIPKVELFEEKKYLYHKVIYEGETKAKKGQEVKVWLGPQKVIKDSDPPQIEAKSIQIQN